MVTIIKKDMKLSEIEDVLEKRKLDLESKNEERLKKHFGSLQRGIDGLKYQKSIRNDIILN
jgi:hypothetical protein